MALNFPTDTSLPYFDPNSGLKYLYNASIGAWETAIQPPAVVRDAPPSINIEGFLWWDEVGGRLQVWYVSDGQGAWVDASPLPEVIAEPSDTPPTDPKNGDLWWNTVNGRMYIWYVDSDGGQWVDASPDPHVGSLLDAFVSQNEFPPPSPDRNDMWFNPSEGTLYIWYEDPDSSQWVPVINATTDLATVNSISSVGAISIGGTVDSPILSILDASTTVVGASRFATASESTTGTATNVSLSPGVLSTTIVDYLPSATETTVGVVELATTSEAAEGVNATKAITPKVLKESLPGLGNPTGTIITFATQTAPAGYVKCDGAAVSRNFYGPLFSVIGTTHGAGDTVTTFNLPNLPHENVNIIHCVKT